MTKTFHFIAGLPRSGSTLLCNLLLQNPRFYASATSGIVEVLRGIKDGWDNVVMFRAMPAAESRQACRDVLLAALEGFYHRIDRPVVFDKSRAWPAYIEMLAAILPEPPKILVPVRALPEVIASFELRYRETAALGQVPIAPQDAPTFQTLEGRCTYWVAGNQPIGAAYNAIKDALARGHRERLHFIRFEELATAPTRTLQQVYDFLGEPWYDGHDFDHVEQLTTEDDRAHGLVGLHDIRPAVQPIPPRANQVLGALAQQFAGQELW